MSYVFYHGNGRIYRIRAFWYFSNKIGCQKYDDWVPGDPCHVYVGLTI